MTILHSRISCMAGVSQVWPTEPCNLRVLEWPHVLHVACASPCPRLHMQHVELVWHVLGAGTWHWSQCTQCTRLFWDVHCMWHLFCALSPICGLVCGPDSPQAGSIHLTLRTGPDEFDTSVVWSQLGFSNCVWSGALKKKAWWVLWDFLGVFFSKELRNQEHLFLG